MALQKEITVTSVKDVGGKFSPGHMLRLTLQLECWAEGVDKEVIPSLFTKNFSVDHKTTVANLTVDQLIQRTMVKMNKEMQPFINAYLLEESYKTNAKLLTGVQNLLDSLEG